MPSVQIYLVAGDEDFLRQKAILKIKSGFSEQITPLIYYSDEKTPTEVVDICRSLDMLSKSLFVIYKGYENLTVKDQEVLNKYIQKPNPATCLVIESAKRYAKGKKPYDKLIKLNVVECNKPQIRQLPAWINNLAKEQGKNIETQAVESLIAKCGNNLKNINDALEKLALYAAKNKVISLDDVQSLIGFDAEYTAYNLIDEIFKKNTKEALRIAARVVSKDKDIFALIGLMTFQLTRLSKAKNLLKKNISQGEVLQHLGVFSYLADNFIKQVNASSSEVINQAVKLLAEADLSFKTLPGNYKNDFDSLIIKLCALK
jgi:DNA polymerase-3 subunit delta